MQKLARVKNCLFQPSLVCFCFCKSKSCGWNKRKDASPFVAIVRWSFGSRRLWCHAGDDATAHERKPEEGLRATLPSTCLGFSQNRIAGSVLVTYQSSLRVVSFDYLHLMVLFDSGRKCRVDLSQNRVGALGTFARKSDRQHSKGPNSRSAKQTAFCLVEPTKVNVHCSLMSVYCEVFVSMCQRVLYCTSLVF